MNSTNILVVIIIVLLAIFLLPMLLGVGMMGGGMMGMGGGGWGTGWGFGWIFGLLFMIALIIGVVWLVKNVAGSGTSSSSPKEESALELLKKRYARGEINREEFEEKNKDLSA